MTNRKQLKITKLFRKGATRAPSPDEFDELKDEIQKLEDTLKEKQNELFQLQRNSYRQNLPPPAKTLMENCVRPQKIVLTNSVEHLSMDLDLMAVLSGMEVQSYVKDDHCCVTYNMQHDTKHLIKHGLRIELKGGVNEISKSDLPIGFNLQAVMEDFDNIMVPDCLGAIRKALVAYYNRRDQFDALKSMLNIEAQLFKILDGSHMEITFLAQNAMEEDSEAFEVVLMLDYRLYDIRPKQFSIKEDDVPEGAADVLREQCALFKRNPLAVAFRDAFIDTAGPYVLAKQVGPVPAALARRWRRPNGTQDDTFVPQHEDDDQY